MPKKRKANPLFLWGYFFIGYVGCMEITFDNQDDGFFLKESYNKNHVPDPHGMSRSFIVNKPSDTYRIEVGNGPFEAHKTFSQSLLESVNQKHKRNNSHMHRNILFNMDVSAHIVSDEISPKLPRLQVLIHASPHATGKKADGSPRKWCAQVYVEAPDVELTSVCILTEQEGVCVAGVDLHTEWWSQNGTLVNVSYSLLRIDQNNKCASAANSMIPAKSLVSNNESGIVKQFISSLYLTLNERSYDEWKDEDILIDVPRDLFHQGDSFEIPIRLEADSDLQVFVMRARVRQGLHITGARMADPNSQWSIHVDINERQKIGTVTAFVRDARKYNSPKKVQDVFHWQMEVEEGLYDKDTGRIVWSIEYQRNGISDEMYTSEDSKHVSRINIRSKGQRRLVPVLKVSEILNLAVLTGRDQVYPLSIFAVDDSDKFEEVTLQTKCHSVEVDVLKVSPDCTSIYVNGAESRGSHNVSIIAKSGRMTAFMYITVWVPEDRLDIQLSDSRLSQIRGWKVPAVSRRKRALDIGPAMSQKMEDSHGGRNCRLRVQQAVVEVYTRFHIQSPHHTDFFRGRKAFLKVTDLVQPRMRMSDKGIATLNGNLIEGHGQGRTEIQILSPRNGRVLSAKEIRVGQDKVSIKKLIVRLVTGLTLDLQPSQQIDGALVAMATIQSNLFSKHQEGVIDIEIQFSDLTLFPLRYVPTEDYFLKTETLNPNAIGIVRYTSPYQPRIVAQGEDEGDLVKISLSLSESCIRRKSKPLISEQLYVHADFSRENELLYTNTDVLQDPKTPDETSVQRDAHYDTNRPSDRWQTAHGKSKFSVGRDMPDNEKFHSHQGTKDRGKKDFEKMPVITINNNDLANVAASDSAARQEPLRKQEQTGLSPLEIGMYVLLAVFCVAITVFMVNCVVFMVRYKRKQMPKADKTEAISNANDWVWIGRATLERNSVNTRCSQTLMPEEDFNGNHTRPPSTSGSSSSPSSAPNSNRNSTVSTYKGSECSIRITANPLSEAGAVGGAVAEETQSEGRAPQWDYEAMGMDYNQLLDYFDNLKESAA